MRNSVPSNQMKALAMAIAGAIVAAVATMFVPAATLEAFTGATGLSELVPAAAAPLGDTARAMFAFAAGALTLAVLAFLLLRQDSSSRHVAVEVPSTPADAGAEEASLAGRLARIALPKMPWAKGEDDITDLADLPKLRNGDVHPDAPPRRPLSAQQDLPVLNLGSMAIAARKIEDDVVTEIVDVAPVATSIEEPLEEIAPVNAQPAPAPPVAPVDIQPTLAEMVAQLEAAVAERQNQLAELEAVAAQLGAGQVVEHIPVDPVDVGQAPVPAPFERPPLEAVPASVKDDDMDSALAAALATLHRMNGTDR